MQTHLPVLAILTLLLVPAAAAAPPHDVPPGLADRVSDTVTRDDGSVDWPTVGVSVGAAALLVGAAYALHRRTRTPPIQVQSDEDAVLEVLQQHDGQTTQPTIQEALDWTPSKVSRVTTRMEDDGQIKKLQLGRENVVKRVE